MNTLCESSKILVVCDCKGRSKDNIWIERLWRTIK